MSPDLTEVQRRFLEAFIEWHRDRYSEEWGDDRPEDAIDAFLREAMQEGFTPPAAEYREEIADRAGVEDYSDVMDRLEEKGVFDRQVDVAYRLPREDDEGVEDRTVEREMLVFDPDVLEVLF